MDREEGTFAGSMEKNWVPDLCVLEMWKIRSIFIRMPRVSKYVKYMRAIWEYRENAYVHTCYADMEYRIRFIVFFFFF